MKCVEIVGAITDIGYISFCFGPSFNCSRLSVY